MAVQFDGDLKLSTMPKEVRRAYQIWSGQRQRCYYKKSNSYKTYGAVNIQVEYTSREFIAWFVEEIKKQEWKDPCVGRIDHSKNYRFDNIKIEERSEGSKEKNKRCGTTIKPRPIICYDSETMEPLMWFESIQATARFLGKGSSNIQKMCVGVDGEGYPYRSTKDGYTFRYV